MSDGFWSLRNAPKWWFDKRAYSQALRDYLTASNIPFQERNVDDSFGNLMGYMCAAGRGGRLPLVQVGPRVVSKGFYRREIDDALRIAGYKPAAGAAGPEGASERR